MGGVEKPDTVSSRPATLMDLAWAAGFLEGEGSFVTNGPHAVVQAFQVELEPLERIRSFFGGRLTHQKRRGNRQDIWIWRANGPRARSIMYTLWPLLSVKRREQIRRVL